ncbi:unnamed protein product [Sphagnum troendelagicum]|uniref:Uncharacterized protein n=1 Tax=Sphagnum troendelagicum TaxID=128251 RepID=A0ABP0UBU0_9BRYO
MSVMVATVVREMGMMHLVVGSESYKTASGVVTRALGRIDEVAEKDVTVNTRGTSCGSMEAELEKLSLVGSEDVSEIVTDTDSEDGSTHESQPEEVSDSNDYTDWIQWVSDAEEQRACSKGAAVHVKVPVVLQAQQSTKEGKPPNQEASLSDYFNTGTRWGQISQKFQIDRDLGGDREQQLWRMLGIIRMCSHGARRSWAAITLENMS